MNRKPQHALAAMLFAAALVTTLAGCDVAEAEPSSAPTEAVEQPTVAPVEPVAALATCETILSTEGYADLGEHLILRDFVLQNWDYPLLGSFAQDGIVCEWRGGGDVMVVVGQLPMTESDWATTKTRLLAEGFVPDDSVVAGFLNGPDVEDESYPGRGFVYGNGALYYASYADFLKFVPTLQ